MAIKTHLLIYHSQFFILYQLLNLIIIIFHRRSLHYFFLTHWGRDRTTGISQTIFSNAFSWMSTFNFRKMFLWNVFLAVGSNRQYATIGLDKGLTPNWWHHCIWINDGLVYWRIYASLGLNEFNENVHIWLHGNDKLWYYNCFLELR